MIPLFSHKIFRTKINHSQTWMCYPAWLFLCLKYFLRSAKACKFLIALSLAVWHFQAFQFVSIQANDSLRTFLFGYLPELFPIMMLVPHGGTILFQRQSVLHSRIDNPYRNRFHFQSPDFLSSENPVWMSNALETTCFHSRDHRIAKSCVFISSSNRSFGHSKV